MLKQLENTKKGKFSKIKKKGSSFLKLLRGEFNMEDKLLELFKIADTLNEKQDKVFAEIKYEADDSKTLRISIRKKDDYKYVEICEMQMRENSLIKWDNIIELFRKWLKDTQILKYFLTFRININEVIAIKWALLKNIQKIKQKLEYMTILLELKMKKG